MDEKNTQVELIPKKGSSAIEHVESHLPASPISQVMELAKDKNFNPANFETMVKFLRAEREWSAKAVYNDAISKFQSECPRIKKNKDGHNYKYSPYDDVMFVIQPILSKHGIAIRFSFPASESPTKMHVLGYISVGSHTEISEFELGVHALPKTTANDARNTGATLSYAKRYCLMNALNIVTEDEDKDAQGLDGGITEDEAMALESLIGDVEHELGRKVNMGVWLKGLNIDEDTNLKDFSVDDYKKATGQLRGKLTELRRKPK